MTENEIQRPDTKVFGYQFDLLKLELELIHKTIRSHDEITKSIKNWAIVTWTASMGAALSQPAFHGYIWIVIAVPLLFWSVDALFRRIQTTFIHRTEDIAQYVNSEPFEQDAACGRAMSFHLLRMRRRPSSRSQWFAQYFGIVKYFSVAALYVGLVFLTLAVWFVIFIMSRLS